MSAKLIKEFLMLPNILTLSRILLIPFFLAMFLEKKPTEAFFVFLLAGLTDVLDGLAARLWHQKSKVGLWLDPAADKLLLTAAFVLLSLPEISRPNVIPFLVVSIVIGRDVLIAIAVLILYRLKRQTSFPPSILGKASTVCQVLTVLLVLLFNALGTTPFILSWMYDTTLVATILSGVHYTLAVIPTVFPGEKRI